jgi:hypothetical protein
LDDAVALTERVREVAPRQVEQITALDAAMTLMFHVGRQRSEPNGQPVFVYRVSKSTNMLWWEFPLEFHMVQYRPQYALRFETPYYNTNAWVMDWTAIGKVTGLSVGTQPTIPSELLSAAEKMEPDGGNNRTQRTPR